VASVRSGAAQPSTAQVDPDQTAPAQVKAGQIEEFEQAAFAARLTGGKHLVRVQDRLKPSGLDA
jgi:hypothetical protein